jgi:ethanolamine transporter EutH
MPPAMLPASLAVPLIRRRLKMMLGLRIAFTAAVMAVCVWLLLTGRPLGGLLIIPVLAIWVRRRAEAGA